MKTLFSNLINQNGYISISEMITTALYHPKFGYYMEKDKIFGKSGDFITSPHISSLFSEIIALFFAYQFKKHNKNLQKTVHLIELGSGDGTFMKDALEILSKVGHFKEKAHIHLVEISEKNKTLQQNKLNKFEDEFDISYWSDFNDVSDFINIQTDEEEQEEKIILIFANEFFDAFGINQYIKTGTEQWSEIVLTSENNEDLHFAFTSQNQIERIQNYLNLCGYDEKSLEKNSIIEISENALKTFRDSSLLISQNSGSFLMIDYGFIENQFISTLQSIKNHQSVDLISNLGDADITHLLDFTAYSHLAQKCGLTSYSPTTQGDFLKSVGIEEKLKLILEKTTNENDAKNLILSINRLISNDQMGDLFKVLIAEKYD